MTHRLDCIRAALAEERLDALWVSGPVDDVLGRHSQNRFYVSGFTGSAGHALVTRDRAILAVDFRYVEQAEREAAPNGFEVWQYRSKQREWVPELVKHADLPGKRVGVSTADMTYGAYLALQAAVKVLPWGLRPDLGPASPILEKLRRIKSEDEVQALQRAVNAADAAFEEVWHQAQPEQTERALAEAVARAVEAHGATGVSFDTIVGGGAWGAMPHATPRDVAIGEGQPIVVDMGALVGGYCSDLTRTFVLGEADARFHEVYAVVFEAQRQAIEQVEVGMTGVQAHALAASVIEEHGYGERFGHGLGHGVGLDVHEAPYLGVTSEDVLEEGMVFTIEPGIYLPGWGGVRIEDVVMLKGGRAQVLSHATKLSPAGV